MSHEVVRFRQKHKLFPMINLEVALALTAHWGLELLDSENPNDIPLRNLLTGWLERLRMTAAFFDSELDERLVDEQDRARLVRLLDRSIETVQEFGDNVPAELLNRVLRLQGIGSFEKGFPVDVVRRTIGELRELVSSQSAGPS